MTKYKAVGFDHTGVIIGVPAAKFNQNVSDVLGVKVEDFIKAFHNHNQDYILGRIVKKEFWSRILKDLDKLLLLDTVMNFITKPMSTNAEVIDVIHDLRKEGYKLGLLSNDTTGDYETIRTKEHLDKIFDVLCIAAETKLVKPNKNTFDDFANKLGVNLDELIFIDDSEPIINTTNKLGITGILLTDPKLLRSQLKEKGVL
jgi:HAD superfamily hydrolase (TIGR01509 family)